MVLEPLLSTLLVSQSATEQKLTQPSFQCHPSTLSQSSKWKFSQVIFQKTSIFIYANFLHNVFICQLLLQHVSATVLGHLHGAGTLEQ